MEEVGDSMHALTQYATYESLNNREVEDTGHGLTVSGSFGAFGWMALNTTSCSSTSIVPSSILGWRLLFLLASRTLSIKKERCFGIERLVGRRCLARSWPG
jgi:hypothetical protein